MSSSKSLLDALRQADDETLARLLADRPDLSTPPPSSVSALATRAGSRAGVERALAQLSTLDMTVLESIAALSISSSRPADIVQLVQALGVTTNEQKDDVLSSVDRLMDLALVWKGSGSLSVVPSVLEVLGPYPAGLGTGLHELLAALDPDDLTRLSDVLEAKPATDTLLSVAECLIDPAVIHRLVEQAPRGTHDMLDALTWKSPVGQVEHDSDDSHPIGYLKSHGLLYPIGPSHVMLPREISLILRGGKTHQSLPTRPAIPASEEVTADESLDAAQRALAFGRAVRRLLSAWSVTPPAVLKSGGVALRDVRFISRIIDLDETSTTLAIEICFAAKLIGDEATGPVSHESHTWVALEDVSREESTSLWARCARAWLEMTRTPWLVGTRDTKGELRPTLDPDLTRPWSPWLRRQILTSLARFPDQRISFDALIEQMSWSIPRALPGEQVISAVLSEADILGLTSDGGLTPAGLALLHHSEPTMPDPLVDALEKQLPPVTNSIDFGPGITLLVAGRPGVELETVLDDIAEQGRGSDPIHYELTENSLRQAINRGRNPEDIFETLTMFSGTEPPIRFSELISATSQKIGVLRSGSISSYIRCDTPETVDAIIEDLSLAHLQLFRIAPTVIVSPTPLSPLVEVLHSRGFPVVPEDPDGHIISPNTVVNRTRRRRLRLYESQLPPVPDESARLDIVATMRTGEERVLKGQHTGSPEGQAAIRERLAQAVDSGADVQLVLMDTSGQPIARTVRALSLDDGRLRALDLTRGEEEILVSLSMVHSVS